MSKTILCSKESFLTLSFISSIASGIIGLNLHPSLGLRTVFGSKGSSDVSIASKLSASSESSESISKFLGGRGSSSSSDYFIFSFLRSRLSLSAASFRFFFFSRPLGSVARLMRSSRPLNFKPRFCFSACCIYSRVANIM